MKQIESGGPVLVKFSAAWCPDCKALRPHFKLASKRVNEAGVSVLRITLQKEKRVFLPKGRKALAQRLGIRNFPWVGLFNEGKLVSATVEETTGDGFGRWLDYALSRLPK